MRVFVAAATGPTGKRLGVVTMNEIRGASHAKAQRELAWWPTHTSWREGFAAAPREALEGMRA